MFLLFYGSIFFAIVGYVILLVLHFPYNNLTTDQVQMFKFFWVVSLTGSPFYIWWYFVIRSTFIHGEIIEAKVTDASLKKLSPDFMFQYAFTHKSEDFNHHANLIPNSVTKSLAMKKTVLIIYNAKKNVSFILEAYNKKIYNNALKRDSAKNAAPLS